MRTILAVSLLACLAGCAGDPRSLGITGPGVPAPPVQTDEDANGGLTNGPDIGTTYRPGMQPGTGGGRFWGYN